MTKSRRGLRSRLAILTSLVAALGLTAAAPAQFGEAAGFGEMMSPYFLRRDLTLFVDELELDEGQGAILESLYWDYEDQHEAGKVRMLERLSNMRNDLNNLERDRIMQMVFQPFEDRSEEWESMRTMFLQNVEAILNNRQIEMYPKFRRHLRRQKEIPKGRFSGESVDLFIVIRSLDLAPATLEYIQPTLDSYDVRLDEALEIRERQLRDSRMAMMTSIKGEDHSVALRIYDAQIQARIGVRRVNDEFTSVIADSLSEEDGEMFRIAALERAYPRVFRATAAQRILTAAQKLDALSSETLVAIAELEASYLIELVGINQNLMRLLQEYEPEETRYRASSFAARSAGTRPPKPTDPTRPEFRRRDDMGRRYIEMLRQLLTPEQFQSLPGAQRAIRQPVNPREKSAGAAAAEKKRRMLRNGAKGGTGLKAPGGGGGR